LGLLIAGISCFFLILGLLAPVYLLVKALGYRANPDGRRATSSEDVSEPIISSSESTEIPQSRKEFIRTLENVEHAGLEIYKYLTYAIVAVLIAGGVYFASVATAANGLMLFAFSLFVAAAVVFSQMERFRRIMTGNPSINITKTLTIGRPGAVKIESGNITETVTVGEPTVVKMETNTLQQAQDLLNAGKNMDAVCREINPEYAKWGSIQQQLFRKTMEAVLKSQLFTGS